MIQSVLSATSTTHVKGQSGRCRFTLRLYSTLVIPGRVHQIQLVTLITHRAIAVEEIVKVLVRRDIRDAERYDTAIVVVSDHRSTAIARPHHSRAHGCLLLLLLVLQQHQTAVFHGSVLGERRCSIGWTVIASHRVHGRVHLRRRIIIGRRRRRRCLAGQLHVLQTLSFASILEFLLNLVDLLGELVEVLLLVVGDVERFGLDVPSVVRQIDDPFVAHSTGISDGNERRDDLLHEMVTHLLGDAPLPVLVDRIRRRRGRKNAAAVVGQGGLTQFGERRRRLQRLTDRTLEIVALFPMENDLSRGHAVRKRTGLVVLALCHVLENVLHRVTMRQRAGARTCGFTVDRLSFALLTFVRVEKQHELLLDVLLALNFGVLLADVAR